MRKLTRLIAGASILAILFTGCSEPSQSSIVFDMTAGAASVPASGSTVINLSVQNPGGAALTYEWVSTGGTISGEGTSITWTAPAIAGTYTITATVSDSQGNKEIKQVKVDVLAGPNNPPQVDGVMTAPSNDIYDDETMNLVCFADDPEKDTVSYTWAATGGAISGSGANVTWTPPQVSVTGTFTLSVSVTDSKGSQSPALSFPVTVRKASSRNANANGPNKPPVVDAVVVQWTQLERGKTGLIKCLAHDPDGDRLTYTWEAERGSFTGQGPLVSYTAPLSYVDVIVNVTVSDGRTSASGGAKFSIVCCSYAQRNPDWTR